MTESEFDGSKAKSVSEVDYELQWDRFENHREIVTNTLKSFASENSSLCVLGCGTSFDLELPALARCYGKLTLVDIEGDAIQLGIQKQGLQNCDKINIIGGLDITGVDKNLTQFKRQPSRKLLDQIIMAARDYLPRGLQSYKVVASTCLLSQLLAKATDCVGESDHRFIEFLIAIRKRHVEIMLDILEPGGTGVLITDFVSSESLPELFSVPTKDLQSLLQKAIQEKNYLHGLNPKMVAAVFHDSSVSERITSLKVSIPWRWQRVTKCTPVFQSCSRN